MVNEFDAVIVAQVIVQAEGLQATAVEWSVGVAKSQLPIMAGYTWPVKVDRAKPTHVGSWMRTAGTRRPRPRRRPGAPRRSRSRRRCGTLWGAQPISNQPGGRTD